MLTGYCAGWSLKQLIQQGLGGIPGKITSSASQASATLCNQMVNFLGIMQNEWAGAQAFSSFDTYLAPFVKADNLTYDQTKKCIESLSFMVSTRRPAGAPRRHSPTSRSTDCSKRPQGSARHRRRQGNGFHLRRLQA